MRVLPDDLDIGRPGLADRLDRAESTGSPRCEPACPAASPRLISRRCSRQLDSTWSAHGSRGSASTRRCRRRARQVVLGRIRRARQQLDGLLDDDDLHTLDVLGDADDPRGVMHRADVFVAASRQIVVARPRQRQ